MSTLDKMRRENDSFASFDTFFTGPAVNWTAGQYFTLLRCLRVRLFFFSYLRKKKKCRPHQVQITVDYVLMMQVSNQFFCINIIWKCVSILGNPKFVLILFILANRNVYMNNVGLCPRVCKKFKNLKLCQTRLVMWIWQLKTEIPKSSYNH